jgi:hypothetical protein
MLAYVTRHAQECWIHRPRQHVRVARLRASAFGARCSVTHTQGGAHGRQPREGRFHRARVRLQVRQCVLALPRRQQRVTRDQRRRDGQTSCSRRLRRCVSRRMRQGRRLCHHNAAVKRYR